MRWARIGAVLAVAALLVLAHQLGILREFAEPARLKQTLVQLGPGGYGAFIVAYALLQPFGVPGTVFVVAAPLIWPWPVAFGLSMVGTMAASVIGFSFARFVARDSVSRMIPAKFRKYDDALARAGLRDRLPAAPDLLDAPPCCTPPWVSRRCRSGPTSGAPPPGTCCHSGR
jgi:uncharacterized membrane protein YdjX (TVP38/TMEM64 family)